MKPTTTDRFSFVVLWDSLRKQFVDLDDGLVGRLMKLLWAPGKAIQAALSEEVDVFSGPLRIFLLANVFFFLFGPSVGLLNFSLDSLGQIPFYGQAATDQAARLGLEIPVYRERFDTSYRFRQPTFVVLLTFPLALASYILQRRMSFGRHYVLALILLAWLLVTLPLVQMVVSFLGRLLPWGSSPIWGGVQVGALASATGWGNHQAVSSGLGLRGARALFATSALCLSVILLLAAYGHVVFWITLAILEVGA